MENLGSILKKHPFFQGLEDNHIEFIVGCAANARFKTGLCRLRPVYNLVSGRY